MKLNFESTPPTGTCYIYEEVHGTVTPSAYGLFSVVLGTGTVTAPNNQLLDVFSNDPATPLNDSCAQPYNPSAGDWRRLELIVDGAALSMQTIGASAFAMNAQLLQGKSAADFILKSTNVTQANLETLTGGGDASALHQHDSLYVRKDGSNSFSGNISTSGNIYATGATAAVGVGTGTPAADLHIKKNDPALRLEATSGMGGAPRLEFYSGTNLRGRIEVNEATDGLKFYSGATQAGAFDGSGNLILNGSLQVAGSVGLGKYTNAQEPALITALTGLGAAATGTMWVNSTTNSVRYWNGTSATSLASGAGVVNSVSAGTGLATSGTSTDPVVSLANTAVGAGSYGSASSVSTFTVDAQGRLTAAGTTAIAITADQVVSGAGKYLTYAPNNVACSDQQVLKWNNASTRWECGADTDSGGDITGVTAGTGLSGGGTSGALTLSLATSGVGAGTYSKVTVDTYGRVTSATDIGSSEVTTALGFTPVNKAGDTMTGLLVLSADPSANLGAATKQYIDSAISTAGGSYTKKDGTVAFTGDQSMGSHKLTNVTDPAAAQDAATKNYVDTKFGGSTLDLTGLADGQAVKWNAGSTKWEVYTPAAGTVTSVGATAPLSNTGTASAPVIALADTAVTPASYGSASSVSTFTVDAKGRLTAAGTTAIAITPDQVVSGAGKYLTYAPNNVACSDQQVLKWNNASTRWECGADTDSGGDITGVTAGTGLSGGGTSGALALSLATSGVGAGTYSKVTVDTYGRVTSATDIGSSEVTTALGYTPVNKAGDTMTGLLVLSADPSANLGAATKQYIDSAISTAGGSYTKKDGTVAFTGDQSMGSHKLTNVTDPAAAQDAATKNYVDTKFGGSTLDLTGLADGQAVKWNAGATKWDVYTPVQESGSTMTGALSITAGSVGAPGLSVSGDTDTGLFQTAANILNIATGGAERVRIDSSGNVGVATASPRSVLDVAGTITGKPSVVNATATVDFSTGNIQHTASDCGAFALHNLKDGATYMFIVKGTTSATCSFTAYSDAGSTSLTVKMPPGHSATTAAKHTLYNFLVSGTDLYVSWVPGY